MLNDSNPRQGYAYTTTRALEPLQVETYYMLCVLQNGVKGVFIGSHGRFPPWRCTTKRPPCGRLAMICGQTDLVMSVPSFLAAS
jgi:hypothetical protein